MPGIVGIIDPLLTMNESERLEQINKMCCAVKHHDWYRLETFLKGPLALGHIDHGIFKKDLQPINNKRNHFALLFHGEIYNSKELKNETGIEDEVSNSKFLLTLFEKYGNNFIFRLNGAFNIIIWDSKEKKLIVVNDRYGLRPIYYSQYNSKLYLASEVKAILTCNDISKNIDDYAVASLFFFRFVAENRTYFESIKLLPPGSFLVFKDNKISISNYWDFNFSDKKEDKSHDYYEEMLGNLILQAVERHVKDNVRVTVPLSGGLDSRTILASIRKEYYPINSITFGTKDMDDVRIAKLVSNTLGTNHHFLEILPENIIDHAKKIVNITDGMISFLHSVGNMTFELIRDYTDICLVGMQLFGNFFGPLATFRSKEKLLTDTSFFRPMASSLAKSLFTESYYKRIKDYPGEIIRNISRKCKSVSASSILDYCITAEYMRRFSNYGDLVIRTHIEIRSPLMDNDLVDFIINAPPDERRYQSLYTRTFPWLFPELSKIPWEKTGLLIGETNTYSKMTSYLIQQYLKEKIHMVEKKLTGDKYFKARQVNLFVKYIQWSRENENLISFIRRTLLNGKAYSRRILNIKTVERVLEEHIKGKYNHIELISRLLTFELWSRLFIN